LILKDLKDFQAFLKIDFILVILNNPLDVQVFFNNNDTDWVSAGINRLDLSHFPARLVLIYPCADPIRVVIIGIKKYLNIEILIIKVQIMKVKPHVKIKEFICLIPLLGLPAKHGFLV